MDKISGGAVIGLLIFYAILCMVVYWKSVVLVFDFGNAVISSIVFSLFGGLALLLATLYFWKIAIVVVCLIGIGLAVKSDSGGGKAASIILAIILAVVIAVVGNIAADAKAVASLQPQTYSITVNV